MRATLVEIEGETTGTALYSMEWLRDRVRWHLDPDQATAAVLLAETPGGHVVGHTIVRRETEVNGAAFGLVSTTFVEPGARRQGSGEKLLLAGEHWFRQASLPSCCTWTSAANAKLIRLYEKHGYGIVDTQPEETTGTVMVKLHKWLNSRPGKS